jgi:intracellular sulfur oxidation DsrE/DsrF family protein
MMRFLFLLGMFFFLSASFLTVQAAEAQAGLKPMPELQVEEDYFPGDPPAHHVVYMLNKADVEYQTHILNSVQAMIKMYGGNVEIAVVFIGPGMNLLAKKPVRKVDPEIVARVDSFANDYGVRMIACGNTMNTVGWSQSDIKPYAEYALVGASALMVLQEKGFAYISW